MEFYKPIVNYAFINCNFSTIFSGNIANYPVYFLAGRCLFDFFSAGTKIAMNSIKGNSGILKEYSFQDTSLLLEEYVQSLSIS